MKSSKHQRVQSIISQMTLDEKLAQLGSFWVYQILSGGELDAEKMDCLMKHGIGQVSRMAGASSFSPRQAAKAANTIQNYLVSKTRLGIPAIIHEECCCGAMVKRGTVFPQMLGLSATFQPELACAMASTIRSQLRAIGARHALAPVLDIARDPRWGRVEETFGEDPTLTTQFGTAYIRGLQGQDLSRGVLATGKHFIGHSFSQGGLNCGPVHMGWHEIYNICLAPFQAAIRQAGLATVMNSYPELDGEVVAASRRILTGILRDELGFDGLIVSDYEAVQMLHTFHYVAPEFKEAARMGLEAGIDVELPALSCYGEPLKQALESGEIDQELIDRSVGRHLDTKFELGLFDNPYVNEDEAYEVFADPGSRELARKIAAQSMVLLKNDGILPVSKSIASLAVIGPNAADSRNMLGDYAYASAVELLKFNQFYQEGPEDLSAGELENTSILDAVRAVVSPTTKVYAAKGCGYNGSDTAGFDQALRIANMADLVVLVLGDRSGMIPDCTTGETRDSAHLRLPGVQEELARAVIATGKPVVVVLVNGRPYAIPWLAENSRAILEAWLPGQEGGAAVAGILFGDANPGGKLPITFPRCVGQMPVYHACSPAGKSSFWYKDYADEAIEPLFPFGHGLSYTTFAYEDFSISAAEALSGETVDICLRVTNTGPVAGEEVVQLYIRDEFASLPRPIKELKGFIRLALEPGEARKVIFHLPVDQLAFYNQQLELVVEAGKIKVMAGSSSEDIRLQGEFEIRGPKKVIVVDRVFSCPVEII